MRCPSFAILASLFVCVAAEFKHFRGQTASLTADASPAYRPAESTQVVKSEDMPKNIINFLKGKLLTHRPRDEKEDIQAVTDFKEFGLMNTGEIFVSFCLWLILYFLASWYYHSYVRFHVSDIEIDAEEAANQRKANYTDFEHFHDGLFDCGKYRDICGWSFCCATIRWSDTMSKVRLHRYWPAFLFTTALLAIAFIPLCTVPCWIILVAYMTYHRQGIRWKFDFSEIGGSTVLTDMCTYCCCMCCAVAQEARHVRAAIIADHPATHKIDDS